MIALVGTKCDQTAVHWSVNSQGITWPSFGEKTSKMPFSNKKPILALGGGMN
jgi:hypothetical protein